MDKPTIKLLTEYLTQIKFAERDSAEAKRDAKKWYLRARLAVEQSQLELASEAKARAQEARQKFEIAERKLQDLRATKELLVREAAAPSSEAFRAAFAHATHTLGEFQKLGIDTRYDLPAAADLPSPDKWLTPEQQAERELDSYLSASPTALHTTPAAAAAAPAHTSVPDPEFQLAEPATTEDDEILARLRANVVPTKPETDG